MKKLLCFTLTAVLAAALAAPAFADTAVNQDSSEKKASTTVEFKIDPTYTVTIPATVNLVQKTDADTKKVTYEQDFDITASNVRLNENQKLKVSLQSDYKLTVNNTALKYELPYTVKTTTTNPNTSKDVTTADTEVATFGTNTTDQTVTLHFAADNPTYAGDYSDKVTFNLAVVVDTTQNENGGN